jgi:SAM-dependent methyltransferase
MARSMPKNSVRTPEQIREHYEVEKELANRLRHASREERTHLYAEVYNELYQRVPHHSQLLRKSDEAARANGVAKQMNLLKPFLRPETIFLEIGAGDGGLSFKVAEYVHHVYAIDVSVEITRSTDQLANFDLILSDGRSIPVPAGSVTVAYSNQLMEHLHPDDALEQLQNIAHALAPGGLYICQTPNAYLGPSDISKHFDDVATGLHLKEYTTSELIPLFRTAGFSKFFVYTGTHKGKGFFLRLPTSPVVWIEYLVAKVPHAHRKTLLRRMHLHKLLGRIMAIK